MSCRYDAEAGYLRADGELCHERHCYSCGRNHADQLTCAWCVGEARQILRDLGELCDALPEEAEARGVQSEAMNLLGPACDPEARGHLAASVAVGRVSADYLEAATDERHPLLVLGGTQMEWEDVLEHESVMRVTVGGAIHYLSANLTDMAQSPLIDYAETLAQWRACLAHLRVVLHDGDHRRKGAPCPTCEPAEELVLEGETWVCYGCRKEWDEDGYQFLVRREYLKKADWLTSPDCAEVTGVPAGTIRWWASEGRVQRKTIEGRVHYRVAHVRERLEMA